MNMENEKYNMGTLQISIKAEKLGIAIKTTLQNIWPRAQINVHYAYVIL